MKGLFLEELIPSARITCCGWADSLYLIREDRIIFLDDLYEIKLGRNIEWAVSSGSRIYAITNSSVYVVVDRSIFEAIPIEIRDVRIEKAWYKSGKIFILTETEVIICSVTSKKVLRYEPYGHRILSMDFEYMEENVFLILLTSCEQNVVRLVNTKNSLEEIGQISVSKEVYKIYSMSKKRFLAVEKSRISLYDSERVVKSMCFGSPLVRAGCVLSEDECILSILTDELYIIDLNEFVISKYIRTPAVITEGIVVGDNNIYIYNRRGDIGVLSESGVDIIQKGYIIEKMKKEEEFENSFIYAIKRMGNGNSISRISRRRKKKFIRKIDLKEKPVQILSNNFNLFIRYKNRSEIRKNNLVVKIEGDVLACSLYQDAAHFIRRKGVLGRVCYGKREEYCVFCDYSRTGEETEYFPEHSHNDALVLFADTNGDCLVYTIELGTYLWKYTEKKKTYLGKYSVYSLSVYNGVILIGEENSSVLIREQLLVPEKIEVSGRMVIQLAEKEYLVHGHDGSLYCVLEKKKNCISTGSTIVKDITQSEKYILVNTINSSILVYKLEDQLMHAEYVESIGGSGISCLNESSEFLVYEYAEETNMHSLGVYELIEGSEYQSVDLIYDKDILDFIPFKQYMVVVSSKERKICTDPVKLDVESGIVVSVHDKSNNQELSAIVYDGAHSVQIIKTNSEIIIGINNDSGSMLVVLRMENENIVEKQRKVLQFINIVSLGKYKDRVYCTTTNGLIMYSIREHGENPIRQVISPVDAKYEIRKSYLIEYILTQIKLYRLQKSSKQLELVYVDRLKSAQKVLRMFNKEYFLVGYNHETEGSLCLLQKTKQCLKKVLAIGLPAPIVSLEQINLSLVQRADSMVILTETGAIYRISLLTENLVNSLSLLDKENTLSDSILLFASDKTFLDLAAISYTDKKIEVCSQSEKVDLLGKLL